MTSVRLSADVRVFRKGQATLVDGWVTGPARFVHHQATDDTPDIVFLVNQTAGLFGGDRERWRVTVGSDVTVAVTDPGPTRAYPGRGPGRGSTRLRVAPRGVGLLLPHPFLPTRGSDTQMDIRLDVAHTGEALVGEIVCPGRVGSGEGWGSSQVKLRLRVFVASRLVFADALRAGDHVSAPPKYLLTMAAVGRRVSDELVRDIRATLAGRAAVSRPDEGLLLVTGLADTQQLAIGLLTAVTDAWLTAGGSRSPAWRRLGFEHLGLDA